MSNKEILEKSNNIIINLINKNKPFIISRLGHEICMTYIFLKKKVVLYKYTI